MLTQSEFDYLVALKKKFKEDTSIPLGSHPTKWSREIISLDSHDLFILDFTRVSIEVKKFSLNEIYKRKRYSCNSE